MPLHADPQHDSVQRHCHSDSSESVTTELFAVVGSADTSHSVQRSAPGGLPPPNSSSLGSSPGGAHPREMVWNPEAPAFTPSQGLTNTNNNTPGLVTELSSHSDAARHRSDVAVFGDGGDEALTGVAGGPADALGFLIVVDPLSRKLAIPRSAISRTQAMDRTGTPSLCILHFSHRCRQGSQCHQVHADPTVVSRLRKEARQLPTCCVAHGDINAPLLPVEWRSVVLDVLGVTIPVTRCAFTEGLARILTPTDKTSSSGDATPTSDGGIEDPVAKYQRRARRCPAPPARVRVQAQQVCRLHGGERCRYSEDCKFVHVCRHIVKQQLSAAVPPMVSQLELRHGAAAAVSEHELAGGCGGLGGSAAQNRRGGSGSSNGLAGPGPQRAPGMPGQLPPFTGMVRTGLPTAPPTIGVPGNVMSGPFVQQCFPMPPMGMAAGSGPVLVPVAPEAPQQVLVRFNSATPMPHLPSMAGTPAASVSAAATLPVGISPVLSSTGGVTISQGPTSVARRDDSVTTFSSLPPTCDPSRRPSSTLAGPIAPQKVLVEEDSAAAGMCLPSFLLEECAEDAGAPGRL